ncbi:hypothetical protein [Corallococcus sp. AB011P]|uniref:hypothetical protein n=1 Tax=Corallococcus sp. AB011P TaxID=2316735 RepID=UPI001F19AB9B|nr:hypothetical protein [Corallococcus sp. AB011P]
MKPDSLLIAAVVAVLLPLHSGAQSSVIAFGDSLSDNGTYSTATSGPVYRTELLRHQVGRNQAACLDSISSRRA